MKYTNSKRDFTIETSASHSFRAKRMELFFDDVYRTFGEKRIKILDVGGSIEFWEIFLPKEWIDSHITILNLDLPKTTSEKLKNFCCVKGDATNMPEFKTGQFDVVFSNSVIEHVGAFYHQKMMADEVKRIGRYCFIQTPCRFFPIEPHFSNVPFFYFLPKFIQLWIMKKEFPSLTKEQQLFHLNSVRLLSEYELRILFKGLSLKKEKIFGLTKSYMIFGQP